ncbi:MAG: TonB-dependent receptor [Sphingomonas bacterium]
MKFNSENKAQFLPEAAGGSVPLLAGHGWRSGGRRAMSLCLCLLLGCAADAMMHPAAAQTAPAAEAAPADDAGRTGDIVVTAQKRAERLQDVPISVSVLGADMMQKEHVTQVDDLTAKVANLQLSSTVGENTPIFSLRGVSMFDYSLNQAPPVATYYDEVYKGNVALLGVGMYDLQRVEVLRGPQGTLYGKNTTGGAVNLISQQPELDKAGGYVNLGYGKYNHFEANGAINLPLTDTLAVRVAGTYEKADGWFRNLLPGKPDLNGIRQYGIRGSLLWKPAPGVSFLLRAETSLQDPYNYGIYAQPGPAGIGAGVYEEFGQGTSYFRTGLTPRQIESDYTPRRHARTYAVSLKSDVEIGSGLTLTSLTSWDRGILHFGEDSDGSPRRTLQTYYADRATQFAEDVRLTSNFTGPFNFILGAYFNREKVFNENDLDMYLDLDVNGDGVVNAADCSDGFPYACNIVNKFDQVKKSYALYTDMHYDLGGGVTLRGGLRYTHDTGRQTGLTSSAYGVDGVLVETLIPPTDLSFSSDNLSGKIGVDYKISPDAMIYASVSRGYRAPSFNAQAFFEPDEASVAKAEKITSFEVGAKTQFLDRRIDLNLAGFYYIYQNQQMINVDTQTAAQTLVNIDRSSIYGAEAEMVARVSRALDFRLGLGLLHAQVDRGVLDGVDLAGHKLVNAPSVTLNGEMNLRVVDNGDFRLTLSPSVSFSSSQYFEIFNDPGLTQGSYALVGGHIDLDIGRFRASIWSKNLGDALYRTSRASLEGFGFVYNHLGAPRTFGVTFGYKF